MACINTMKPAVRVSVTGASGQIAYTLLFKIASGEMLGCDQPVILQLIETPQMMDNLRGVCMELQDCAMPLLHGLSVHSDADEGFYGAHYAILLGALPRGAGMERKDLLSANAKIFSAQGKSLSDVANPDVRVLVVGNPANTNALIASRNAPKLSPTQFTAMTRLDHNRAVAMIALKLGFNPQTVRQVAVWGNHSGTQFPSLLHAKMADQSILSMPEISNKWYSEEFIPKIAQRGTEIIKVRGKSSAASAAQAAIDHMRSWVLGSQGEWVSMGIISDGSYGIAKGIVFSFPVICRFGTYEIVQGLELDNFSREKLKLTEKELLEERNMVSELLPIETQKSHETLPHNTFSGKTDFSAYLSQKNLVLRADRVVY